MSRASRRHGGGVKSFQSSDTPEDQSTITRRYSPYDRPVPSISSLQNAQIGGDVNGRVFTAGRDIIVNDDNDLVSSILWPQVAAGAMFDSAARQSAGRCHPGTRQRILDRIKEWIRGESQAQRILWMHGSAGAGKSSIMQTICELLRDSDPTMNGAGFFFSRGDTDRGRGTKLFTTLAYQLAVHFPSVRSGINDALGRDPSLPTKSMHIQLKSLIIDPLLRCKDRPSPTPIIFIDGLDECSVDDAQGVDTQCQIVALIAQSLVNDKIPIRFMIASRPEYWIRDSFEISPLLDITLPLSLRDDTDADLDIRRYLINGFDQIRLKKRRIMQSVALPWPPTRIVKRFVEEASGQYIYASTILKFIGDHPFKSPEEQLRIITTPGPHRATAYSELDRLYATIVSAYPEWETMKRVLGGLLIRVNLIVIREIFGVPQTEITLVLDALCSLIDVVPPAPLSEDDQLLVPIFGPLLEDEKISFFHLSFREFLLDKARSGLYYIDIKTIHIEVIGAFFGIIQRNLDENYKIEPHVSCKMSLSEYRRMMGVILHSFPFDSSFDFRGLFLVLNSTMERFHRFDPDMQMNHPACFMRDMAFLFNTSRRMSHMITNADHNLEAVEQTTSMGSFLAIVKKLEELAYMAYKIGIHLLSLFNRFSITPTLFFIHYLIHRGKWGVRFRELLMNPGCTVDDCLSTIQQHRHIIDLPYDRLHLPAEMKRTQPGSSALLFVLNLGETSGDTRLSWMNYGSHVVLKGTIDGGWLCPTEWTNQRVLLVLNCLKSIRNHPDNDWENLEISAAKHFILADFFNDGGISDIHGEGYFENKYNVSFLEVMVDSKAWMSVFPSRPRLWTNLPGVIVPILCWFNRQLTDVKASNLMIDHDLSLLEKMRTAMNTIFQKCFVPNFTTPYFSELVISMDSDEVDVEAISIKINVSTSSCLEENIDYRPAEDHDSDIIARIHSEIFGQNPYPRVNKSHIPRLEWYPCLAAYLLNICVKDLYCRWDSSFKQRRRHIAHSEILFPFIVQCLPYAQTTPQNLDALRAIKALSKPTWSPPSGFCSGVTELLKSYKPHTLSSDELGDFEHWFRGIQEGGFDGIFGK